MKFVAWSIAILAATTFVLSFAAETRLAPLVGAGLLLASIAYATWITQTSGVGSLLKAERGAKRLKEKRRDEQAAS